MFVAVAAMASVSCQKEENAPVNETKSATLTLHATVADTKTYIEDNAVLWGTNEYVQLYFNDGADKYVGSKADAADLWEGESSAMFSFDITYTPAESYLIGGVYPLSAVSENDAKTSPAKYKVDLPATQDATASSYDPAAFIMILKPEVVTNFDNEAHLASFRRAVALNKITLKGLKETITSVTITVPEEKFLAGRRYFDLTTGEEGEIYHAQSNSITVNGTYAPGEVNVWFTSWGVELAQGEQMTVKMTSTTKTYTRTITVNENGVRFVEGDLNTLTVNMSSADEVVLNDLSGEYLIVNADLTCAAQAWNNGNNLPEYALTVEDGTIVESEGLENCKMTIELQSNGKYTIKDAKNNYLYAPSSSNNYLKGLAEASELTDWNIVQEGDKYVLTSLGNNSRNILRYNSSSKIFSCYSSGQADVTLYKYSEIEPDTNPSITLTKNSDEVTYDATSYEFTYTTKNIAGNVVATIKEGATMANVSASASNGTVTVNFDANADAEQKTATIILSYEGATSQEFVLTQAAAGATKQYYVKVTTAPNDWSGTYLMVCDTKKMALSGISTTSTKYGIGTAVDITDNKIEATETLASYQVVLSPGSTSDSYLMKFNGSYLYWSSGNSLATNTSNNANTNWLLSVSEGNVTIKNCKDNKRVIGWNASSPRFACYTSSQTAIQLYKLEDGNAGGETPEPDPTPDPEQPGQGGDAGVVVLSEQFDNSTTSDSSAAIGTNKFPNFSGATSKAYTSQYGGIKLGSSSAVGYITSKSLDLSSAFTVQIDACKYGSDTGNINVTVGDVTKTINNSELGAAGSFKTFTLSFDAATANSTVKIATSSKRAYIDNVVITRN